MALTLRPTGLESPVYNDLKDYPVFSGRWGIGRIYEGARCTTRFALVLDALWSARWIGHHPQGWARFDTRRSKSTTRRELAEVAEMGEAGGEGLNAMWEPMSPRWTSSSRPARISLSTTFRAASHPTPFYARSRRPEATAVPGFRWGPSHE